jgi:pimeloyl-ACP methyl ester carboxylesterase
MSIKNLPFNELTRRRLISGVVWLSASAALGPLYAGESEPAHSIMGPKQQKARNQAWLSLPPTPDLPRASRSGLAQVNQTSIFYAQFGEGPPVLLLHGGLANSNYWGHQVKELAQKYTVTVMDTRGHGRSPVTTNSFSYSMFAADASDLLDLLQIDKAAIIGWSDGAITGLQLAMTKPGKVSRLFAFGANASLDGLKANGARSSVFRSYVDRCRTEYALLSPRPGKWPQLVAGLRHMWRTEPNFTEQRLATVRVPTTISDGEYDEIIDRGHTEGIADAIPGARLAILADVSHFAMLQNPSQFTLEVTKFLTAST